MSKAPTKRVTVLVDKREKNPLLFPRTLILHRDGLALLDPGTRHHSDPGQVVKIIERSATLDAGDYAIQGHEKLVLVERKGGIDELAANTSPADVNRFASALTRMIDGCKYPYLLLDMLPLSVWQPRKPLQDNGSSTDVLWVLDRILGIVAGTGLRLIWGGRTSRLPAVRRKLGEIVLRIMLHHVFAENSQDSS